MDLHKKIEEIYRENYHHLKNFISRKIIDKTYLEDFINETFLRFIQNFKNIKNAFSYKSYLFKIANNLIIDSLRVKNKEKMLKNELIEKNNLIDEEKNVVEDLINFEKKISSLTYEEKLILKLKFVDNLTFKEMSQKLNQNINTLITKFNKAIKKLTCLHGRQGG